MPTNGLTIEVIDDLVVDSGVACIDLRLSGTPTAPFIYIQLEAKAQIVGVQSEIYGLRFYAKRTSGSNTNVSGITPYIAEADFSGAFLRGSAATAMLPTANLTIYSHTATLAHASALYTFPAFGLAVTKGAAVDITLRIGGVTFWKSTGGFTFNGVGNLGGVSAFEETGDLEAPSLELSLSGIPSSLLSSALNDMRANLRANLYLGALNSADQLVADPYLLFPGRTDSVAIEEGAETSSIVIRAESLLADMENPRTIYYSAADQSLIESGDMGFEFVPQIQTFDQLWQPPKGSNRR